MASVGVVGAVRHEHGMMAAASSGVVEEDRVSTLEAQYGAMVDDVRRVFATGVTKGKDWRVAQLKALRRGILAEIPEIKKAMKNDLGRHAFEAVLAEAVGIVGEVDHTIEELDSWMKPESVWHPLLNQPGSSQIIYEPKGVVLVLSPWNYPINLTLMSLIAAISAGNCCVIKPSEVSPASAVVIENIVNKYLDTSAIKVVQGAVAETSALLRVRFDHIIYTGNGAVARIVMTAASKFLTPVTLELGGKSPVYVDKTAKIPVIVKRLLAGKSINNGQTCIAPDHVFVHQAVAEPFVNELLATVKKFFGEDVQRSESYGRIVNQRHWDRIAKLLQPASHGGKVLLGGLEKADRNDRFIPPTIVLNPRMDSPLMTEEIFGWVLPVIIVQDQREAIAAINTYENPLALYVFSEDQAVTDQFLHGTTSGGVCVNDTIMHITNPNLPFGGIGASGMGSYHGVHGFREMSHKKAVMYRSTWIDPAFRYPPYAEKKADAILGFASKEPMSATTKKLLATGVATALGLVVMSRL